MSQSPQTQEAMGALERLFAKKVISLEEGQAAARLIAHDDSYVFPPPKVTPAPARPPAEAVQPPDANGNGDGTSPG